MPRCFGFNSGLQIGIRPSFPLGDYAKGDDGVWRTPSTPTWFELLSEQESLWPATTALAPRMEAWIEESAGLVGRRDDHRRALSADESEDANLVCEDHGHHGLSVQQHHVEHALHIASLVILYVFAVHLLLEREERVHRQQPRAERGPDPAARRHGEGAGERSDMPALRDAIRLRQGKEVQVPAHR